MIVALSDDFHTGMIMMKRGITRFRGMTAPRIQAAALPFVASRVLPECRTLSRMLPLPVVMIVRAVMIMSMRGFMAMAVPMIMMLLMVMGREIGRASCRERV